MGAHHLRHALRLPLYLPTRVGVIEIRLLREVGGIYVYSRHVAGVLRTQRLQHWYMCLQLLDATDERDVGASDAATGAGERCRGFPSPL